MYLQVTHTQEQNDVYMVRQLLVDIEEGRGKAIRNHGRWCPKID